MKKTGISRKVFLVIDACLMILISIACIYPLLYVLFASLSDSDQLMAHSGLLIKPLGLNFDAYKAVLENKMIATGYANTLFVVFVGVALNLVMTSLGAYFLSRKDILLKNAVMGFITFTMFFGGGIIPFFLTVKNLGLYGSLFALILPSAVSTYNMIIMRTSFQNIPDELIEASLIDGAGHITILTKIILPLSKAIIAVMVLYYGVGHWNSWFNAMIFLSDRSKFPLQLVLREILIQNDTNAMMQGVSMTDSIGIAESIKYAVIIVATVPILCVYPFLQKYFVKGVMVGALKG